MKPQATDRTISYALYAALWLILVILQTLLTPLLSPEEVSVFTQPSLYYSTWLTDLYLVLIFYLNYYIFAPQLTEALSFLPLATRHHSSSWAYDPHTLL